MAGSKWVLTRRVARASAIAGAFWAAAGCGALIGLDPGDPMNPDRAPTPATLDDPSVSASPADSQDPATADPASDAAGPQADAGTVTHSEAPGDDAQAPRVGDSQAPAAGDATGAQDAMAASTVLPAEALQPMTSSGPGPGGDVDASTACPKKGDPGGDGFGSGKGPGPGCTP
jgi:hypothetical protein